MSDDLSKEERILQMVKKVLSNVAKDTYTAPGLKHPLSEQTILDIRQCLGLVVARETELAQEYGRDKSARPRFIDEPQSSVVVNFEKPGDNKESS
ncbi:MAG: segregation and condensation protein A [Gammaproteobacteria bacterium]|nr:segregation and condensation protein A [Gammaproteobacteria bacterium]